MVAAPPQPGQPETTSAVGDTWVPWAVEVGSTAGDGAEVFVVFVVF